MLTDTEIRSAKPRQKPYKLAGVGGLPIINPSGSRWWRLKYRVEGKEKLLSLGVYPDVSLKLANQRRDDCRRQLAAGIDPGAKRKAERASEADCFEAIAREWFEKFSATWAPSHSSKVIRRLEMDVFPWIGSRRARDIAPPEFLACLRRVEARGALDTAHRVHQNCGQIFRYAVATGRAERDPAADLRGALPPPNGGHFASITEPARLAPCYDQSKATKARMSRDVRFDWRHWYLSAQASRARRNGRNSTLMGLSGAFLPSA